MTKNFICKNPRLVSKHHNESNDCTVRATSIAMQMDYDEVHSIYAKHGRRPYRGVTVRKMGEVLKSITNKPQEMIRTLDEPTFSRFAKEHPKGRFIVVKRGHAVALIDGMWYDAHVSCVGGRSKVKFYYEVK